MYYNISVADPLARRLISIGYVSILLLYLHVFHYYTMHLKPIRIIHDVKINYIRITFLKEMVNLIHICVYYYV